MLVAHAVGGAERFIAGAGRDRVRGVLRLRASLTAAFLLATCGCTTTYRWKPGHVGPPGTKAPSAQTAEQSRWAHLFVFGLIGTSSVDLRDVCPGPVAAGLRTGTTLGTTLVSVITLGVYTPLEHRFSCVIPPPGPLTIPKVVLEETPHLQPDLDDWSQPREGGWDEESADASPAEEAGDEPHDGDADAASAEDTSEDVAPEDDAAFETDAALEEEMGAPADEGATPDAGPGATRSSEGT